MGALMIRVLHTSGPNIRFVVCVDSRVTLGAVCKGRSSSFQIDGLLRMLLGLQVFGRCRVLLLWVPSASSPADFPSRFLDPPDILGQSDPVLGQIIRSQAGPV